MPVEKGERGDHDRSSGAGEYLEPYREAVRDLGASFESLLWKNPDAQATRFDVMIDTADLRGRVVADMGAGLGDFAAQMHRRGVEYGRYIAVEGVDELAAEAERRLTDVPETDVMGGDFVSDEGLFKALVKEHGVEVFAFSGSLNTLPHDNAVEVLGRAWSAVSHVRGGQVVFNFLSDQSRRENENTGPAHRFGTQRLVGWALEQTPIVVLRHDYWEGHDATIWMRTPG